ncbi:MAG: hypothetical protein ACOX4A_03985 [Saccharofermentanales bacterium]
MGVGLHYWIGHILTLIPNTWQQEVAAQGKAGDQSPPSLPPVLSHTVAIATRLSRTGTTLHA